MMIFQGFGIVGGLFLLASSAFALSAERPLLQLTSSPAAPKVGQKIAVFAKLESSFQNREAVLEGFIGSTPVRFEQSGEELFAAHLNAYTEVKSEVELRVDVSLRDSKKSLHLRQAISQTRQKIQAINEEIASETDPERILELEAERARQEAAETDLEAELDALKTFFKTEYFKFAVEKDPANTEFPLLLSVSPNAVMTGRRTKITLTGERFGESPQVKIGGLNATLISASETSIQVLGPNIPVEDAGMKEIEIRFPPVGEIPRKNAVLSNSFFATPEGILKNLRPVAVTTGYVRAVWPVMAPVTLTGSNSYDENGDFLAYSWEVIAAPAGSAFPAGTLLDPVPTPSFTPDKLGIFRIRFRVQELSTDNEYLSFPSIVTVEVK